MLPGVGGRCSHCRTVIKTKQQNGTLFSKRIYACHLAPLSVRNKIWSECAALHQSVPRPYDPSAALETASFSTATRAVDASTFVGSTVAVSAAAPVIRSSGLKPSTGPMHHFLTAEQVSAIQSANLQFFVYNRVPFLVVKIPAFLSVVKALRPAYVERKLFSKDKKMAGPTRSALYVQLRELVIRLLASRCVR